MFASFNQRCIAVLLLFLNVAHAADGPDDLGSSGCENSSINDCPLQGEEISPQGAVDQKPLWELGLGIGAASLPRYRGSNEQRNLVLPTPYFVYRGKLLRTDRSGLRTTFLDSDRVELDLSFSASLPASSGHSGPRRDMPDLRPTIEFGPSVQVNLWHSAARKARLHARFPVRIAYAVTGGVDYAGLVFSPTLSFNTPLPGPLSRWHLGTSAGPVFATRQQHQYFYDVKPRYALPDRPAYSASGGYSGFQFSTSLSKRFGNFWLGAFVRYDTLKGAAFDDSPLVKRKYALFGGLGITWTFSRSEEMVEVRKNEM